MKYCNCKVVDACNLLAASALKSIPLVLEALRLVVIVSVDALELLVATGRPRELLLPALFGLVIF